MVGFCATVDVSSPVLTALTPHLSFFDSESIYEFDFGRVTAACVVHDESSVHYIQSPSADILLYGKVHTFRDGDSHTQISNANVDSILLSLFKQDGPSFVSRLNGEFAGVIEYSNGETLVFTDRLSTQPIFVTSLNSGIVLSTNLPALTSGLDREFTWAETGLIEYLTFNRVYGTETPVSEIDQIPPAAIRSIKKSGKIHDEIYWKPLYTPKDWNTDSLVRTLADLISTILSERLSKKHSYGLLLSGGSDSRLFLSQANEHDITAIRWVIGGIGKLTLHIERLKLPMCRLFFSDETTNIKNEYLKRVQRCVILSADSTKLTLLDLPTALQIMLIS